MDHPIPQIIHQTWRDTEIPERWKGFQRSWKEHHPRWRYRLWTDLELRNLVIEHYSWFLGIYDNYPEPIQRVDAARYLLLHRYGGVYADLDCECLKSFDDLIQGHSLLIGFEPTEHMSKPIVRAHGFNALLGNALMASAPGHPFWNHAFFELVGAHRLAGPLSTTGPFFLTRAWRSYASPESITCLPAEVFYPGTSIEAEQGRLQDPAWRNALPAQTHSIHHWSGSWVSPHPGTPARKSEEQSIPFTLIERGKTAMNGECVFELGKTPEAEAPLVSCLMITRSSRIDSAKRAIRCFQAQTYPDKELIVVSEGTEEGLSRYLESLHDPRIVHVPVPPKNLPLGKLRNFAVSRARGSYVMQWDDDDLYHPHRIEAQLRALTALGADACFLSRWRIWWPDLRRVAISKKRGWEGSLLCAKDRMPAYDDQRRRGEDTPIALKLASRAKAAFIDAPWLYTYVVHGTNTTPEDHLDYQWAQATRFYWGNTYLEGVTEMAKPLPEQVRTEILLNAASTEVAVPPKNLPHLPFVSATMEPARPSAPKVLILSPVKDGKRFIESYLAGLGKLDYPADRISLGFLESDSVDGTHEALAFELPNLRSRFSRAELFKKDYGLRLSGSRSDASVQFQRRSILARSRNYLLSRALRDEDWVLWLDFDVIDYPADLITRLLAQEKDILVPHCVIAPRGRTFDLNTFIRTETPASNGEFLAQPLKGSGRMYLDEIRDRELVEVDSVGGTVLLVKADLHREGLIFPVFPYKQHLETEGLAFLARDLGSSCWGLPNLEVIHANH